MRSSAGHWRVPLNSTYNSAVVPSTPVDLRSTCNSPQTTCSPWVVSSNGWHSAVRVSWGVFYITSRHDTSQLDFCGKPWFPALRGTPLARHTRRASLPILTTIALHLNSATIKATSCFTSNGDLLSLACSRSESGSNMSLCQVSRFQSLHPLTIPL